MKEAAMPEVLYHYCSNEAFEKIVVSKSVWLSALSLSNDKMEGKLVVETMSRLAQKDSLSDHDIRELQTEIQFFDKVVEGLGFCLSKESDLLSQWRGYASNGAGVAIGFSTDYLKSCCETIVDAKQNKIFTLATVEYDSDKHESLVHQTYEKIRPFIREGAFKQSMVGLQALHSPEHQQEKSAIAALRGKLAKELLSLTPLLFRLKVPAFKEEQEVRLFSYLLKDGSDGCLHRAVYDRVIPYREFKLVAEHIYTPIKSVILGPKHLSPSWVVKNFLIQNGYVSAQVYPSTASYR